VTTLGAEAAASRLPTGEKATLSRLGLLDVQRQPVGRLVAPCPILLQGLHHDPIQIALRQMNELGRLGVPMTCSKAV